MMWRPCLGAWLSHGQDKLDEAHMQLDGVRKDVEASHA